MSAKCISGSRHKEIAACGPLLSSSTLTIGLLIRWFDVPNSYMTAAINPEASDAAIQQIPQTLMNRSITDQGPVRRLGPPRFPPWLQ